PETRTAVIVPALGNLRSRIDRTFREILAPELEDIESGATSGPYEFSLGVPLASTALVGAALDLLQWALAPLPVEQASRLLLSPYFAGGQEYVDRAEFDAFTFRDQTLLLPEASFRDLLRLATSSRDRTRLPALIR